jgi:hypothetical protein
MSDEAKGSSPLTALPCPFCGGTPTIIHGYTLIMARCADRDCPVSGASFLFAQWNTRASAWQPIETAPKDRTRILAGGGDCAVPLSVYWDAVFETKYDEDKDASYHVGAWTDDAVESFAYEEKAAYSPTHWQPLPSLPQAEPVKGED